MCMYINTKCWPGYSFKNQQLQDNVNNNKKLVKHIFGESIFPGTNFPEAIFWRGGGQFSNGFHYGTIFPDNPLISPKIVMLF